VSTTHRYIPITTEHSIPTTLAVQQLLNDRCFVRGDIDWLSAQARIVQELREATQAKRHYLRLTVEDHAKLAEVAVHPDGDNDTGERYGDLALTDGRKIPAGPIILPHLNAIRYAKGEVPEKPTKPTPEKEAPESVEVVGQPDVSKEDVAAE